MAHGKPKVFLDTSVLITALLSHRGGSFYILNTYRNAVEFLINEYVFEETMEVLGRKFAQKPEPKSNFFFLMGFSDIRILPNPSWRAVKQTGRFIEKEDAPILAGALEHAEYLVTLDSDFLVEDVRNYAREKGVEILKSGEYIAHFEG